MSNIQIILADDHQILLDGLRSLLEQSPNFQVVGTAGNGIEVLQLLEKTSCDVLLLDLMMPRMDGLETCKHVKQRFPKVKILVLTTNDEGSIIRTILESGANGYLLKNTTQTELTSAIEHVYKGQLVLNPSLTSKMVASLQNPELAEKQVSRNAPRITKREKEVLELIAQEYTAQEIANQLYVSLNTVITHRRNLLVKLDVKNSVGLVRKAITLGLI